MKRILKFGFHDRGWNIQMVYNGSPSLPTMDKNQSDSIFYAHEWKIKLEVYL